MIYNSFCKKKKNIYFVWNYININIFLYIHWPWLRNNFILIIAKRSLLYYYLRQSSMQFLCYRWLVKWNNTNIFTKSQILDLDLMKLNSLTVWIRSIKYILYIFNKRCYLYHNRMLFEKIINILRLLVNDYFCEKNEKCIIIIQLLRTHYIMLILALIIIYNVFEESQQNIYYYYYYYTFVAIIKKVIFLCSLF